MDGGRGQRRVGERVAGPFEALAADPYGDGLVLALEEAVQVAGGNMVCCGDGARGHVRVVQVPLDEATDVQDEGLPVSLRRECVVRFQGVGNQRGQQVDHHCPEPGPVGRLVGICAIRQLGKQLRQQGAEPLLR